MPFLTILGGIFSSIRIYLILGAVALVGLGVIYVEHLRARTATAEATVAVVSAANTTNLNVIKALQADRAADQAALAAMAAATDNLGRTVSSIKDAINAIPEPKTCQSLDARDRAAIDGVRRLIAPGRPNPKH